MRHSDHVALLRPAGVPSGGTWADLGAGSGAFTLALRELLGPTAEIYALDLDRAGLLQLERAYRSRFGSTERLHILRADFTSPPPDLPPLTGVLMANSLHFFQDKHTILRGVHAMLKSGGWLLLVEYNVDRGNPWVPHPLSFETFRTLAPQAGFSEPRLLARHPSSFLREFFSAAASAKPLEA